MGICGSIPDNIESAPQREETESSQGLPWTVVSEETSSSSCPRFAVILNNQRAIYSYIATHESSASIRFMKEDDEIVSNQRVMYERLLGKQVFMLPCTSSSNKTDNVVNRILSNQNAIFEVLLTASGNIPLPHIISPSEMKIARFYGHELSPALRVMWNQLALYRLVLQRKSCHSDRTCSSLFIEYHSLKITKDKKCFQHINCSYFTTTRSY